MPRSVSPEELVNLVESMKNFEVVDYQGESIIIDDVKGIIKLKGEVGKEELSELKRRSPRGKPKPKQLNITAQVVNRLINNKVKFKVIFGPKEVTIRFDLDHYIRLTDKDVRIVGFSSKNEGVLGLISDVLESYGSLVFLKRVQ